MNITYIFLKITSRIGHKIEFKLRYRDFRQSNLMRNSNNRIFKKAEKEAQTQKGAEKQKGRQRYRDRDRERQRQREREREREREIQREKECVCVCVMIWAAFGSRGKTEIVFCIGTKNSSKYQEILTANFVPFGPVIGGRDRLF
jgi:hypothetical protein